MIDQLFLGVTGVTAIMLTQQNYREDWKRYACLFGMAGQPFWFYATYQAEQWGIFALCFFYAYSWGLGIRNHWFMTKP